MTESTFTDTANQAPQDLSADTSVPQNTVAQATAQQKADSDLVTKKKKPSLVFAVVILLSIGAVIFSSLMVIDQVHNFRNSFSEHVALSNEHDKLRSDWYSYLLDKETYLGTSSIKTKAITEFNMYEPTMKEIIVLEMPKNTK